MFEAYYTSTICRGISANHDHSYPTDAVRIEDSIYVSLSPRAVRTAQSYDGKLVRYFATINHWPATGRMLVTIYAGATSAEIDSALCTAEAPRQDPRTWFNHPCEPERLRISLCRYVDDHYVSEVAEAVFADLGNIDQDHQLQVEHLPLSINADATEAAK
ncbi:hypothetical protein [Arthrobacter sp. 260]|uniref:hypothetical protein n=1 Tax=Arthrobacter sp. 260 TaxID=2735314 RepID=UPI00149275C2|nr:hypothetical protein [Arthrobacter sp. 260]NOJ59738.1 hypothetical protein [Arthrobacter sp. 260]